MHIEQAVFTSAQTRRADGYQIVARSPKLSDDDARELTVWGPSHDSLLADGPGSVSLNLHPLTSGSYCVSRTVPAGAEYSARGGCQVYTHCLVVKPDILARFANNPFALIRAAVAGGHMRTVAADTTRLDAIRLAGRHAPVDHELLALMVKQGRSAVLARTVALLMQNQRVYLVGSARGEQIVAGVVNCLPVAARTLVSLCTGLKASGCRPFRITWLGEQRLEARRAARLQGAVVVDVDAPPAQSDAPHGGWSGLVATALSSGKIAWVAEASAQVTCGMSAGEIDALADQVASAKTAAVTSEPASRIPGKSPSPALNIVRADAPVRRAKAAGATVSRRPSQSPSMQLETTDAKTIELLECLDDAVFEAIRGDADALPRVELLWPVVLEQVGPRNLEESRRQYLRYALAAWREQAGESPRLPDTAVAALEVLCVLFGDGEE